jgi:hypothetical protein
MSYAAFYCVERAAILDVTHGAFSSPLKGEGVEQPTAPHSPPSRGQALTLSPLSAEMGRGNTCRSIAPYSPRFYCGLRELVDCDRKLRYMQDY